MEAAAHAGAVLAAGPEVHVQAGGGGAGGSKNYDVGGGGGGLGWRNNIPVTPGESYTVVVGKGGVHGVSSGDGGDSYFLSPETVLGGGGRGGNWTWYNGGRFVGQGGGNGGQTAGANIVAHAGGGAGGYTGDGGDAHNNCAGSPGEGGGGGAGQDSGVYWGMRGNGGGGVGIYGQGENGKGGGNVIWLPNDGGNMSDWKNYTGPDPGKGGSPAHNTGTDGTKGSTETSKPWSGGNGNGGFPGGGGGQQEGGSSTDNNAEGTPGRGGGGAVRIIWGQGRAFPNTRAGKDECGDGEVFVPPTLNSAGSIPASSTDGGTISVTGASKTDGTLSSKLQYNWHRSSRSDNSVSSLGWSTSNSTVVSDAYSRYWSEVRAKDTEGNRSVIKETNDCTIELPAPPPSPSPSPNPYDCGEGTWSGPQNPGVWSGVKVANLSAGSTFEVGGGYYSNDYVQYAAFFTKNGSTLQVLGSGKWQNEGSELVTWSRGGRCSVRLTANDEVHGVAVTIRHTQTDGSGFGNSLTSSTGRGDGSKTSFLGSYCRGNHSIIACHAGCVFDRTGHYVWGEPSGSGWAQYGDNYIKLFVKYYSVDGTPGTSTYFYSDERSKIVAVAGKNVGQARI